MRAHLRACRTILAIDVVLNASLLLALVVVFDLLAPARAEPLGRARARAVDVFTGSVLGVIAIGVMMSPWVYREGLVVDTRSVLLAAVGLFFGVVPAVVAAVIAALYRASQGGDGAVVGVLTIAASTSIGLILRRSWRHRLDALRWYELVLVGLAVHLVVLGLFIVVPFPGSVRFARDVAPAMLTIHPAAFVIIGLLLSHRLRRQGTLLRLAESEARYHEVFDNEHVAAMIIDPADGRILDVSRRAVEFYGWPREQMLRMTTSDLEVLPRDEVIRQIDEGRAEQRSAFEFEHRVASGEIRDVEVIGGPVTIDGQMRVHAVIHDITDRKRTEQELAAANDRLHHAEKMEAVGRLAGGIAHDFNNMLQVIEGYASLAALEVVPGSELAEHLDEIRAAAERSSELTHQLLAFARRQPVVPRLIDPCHVIGEPVRWLRRLVGEEVEITWVPASTWEVCADPGQLTQVLANLVVNARDAMDGPGRIDISTADVSRDSRDYLRISVADDGPGMSEELMAIVFEPFVTSRGESGGTGLGLSIVDGIVGQHGGLVEVETEPGCGAVFHVFLPRADDEPAGPDRQPATGALAVRPATVLLVEDEISVLRLAERILRRQGHVVLTAGDGDEALEMVRAHDGPIDVLVTDVVMPGASVRDVVTELEQVRPGVAVLYVSGYTDDVLSDRGVDGDRLELLMKPFSADELVTRVGRLLERRTASP